MNLFGDNTKKQRKKRARQLNAKQILTGLVQGKYSGLAKRKVPGRKMIWCVYSGNMSPVRYIGKTSFAKIEDLLRKDKNDVLRIDLRKVRSLHGNSWLKRVYSKNLKAKHEQK